ncbi:uncharacterized protein [Amphiura filiformis]|uniref:uncharacterized protein n=1 Tax=Amphiura filiformis TaxID=82378 RepID=UPI003B218F5B
METGRKMNVLHIVLISATIYIYSCNAGPGANNHRIEITEQQCEATCEECFDQKDSLERMGCLEKCIAEGVDHFTCPGDQSFLSAVTTPSPLLQIEVENFFARRSHMFSAKDVEGIAATLTEDSVNIIDHQMPVIGRANRAQKISDYFTANPQFGRQQFDPVDYGEEYGIICVNGVITDYDSQNKLISSLGFMSLLKRIDGKLQEFIVALFQYKK